MGRKNQRQFKRSTFIFPVRIALKAQEPGAATHFHAFSDNISEGGLKITLKEELEAGCMMELRFDLIIDDQVQMVETDAKIRWVKRLRKGLFEYGFLFENLSKKNWEIIQSFMKEYCVSNT